MDSSRRDAVSLQVNEPVALDPKAPSLKQGEVLPFIVALVIWCYYNWQVFNFRDPSLEEEV